MQCRGRNTLSWSGKEVTTGGISEAYTDIVTRRAEYQFQNVESLTLLPDSDTAGRVTGYDVTGVGEFQASYVGWPLAL